MRTHLSDNNRTAVPSCVHIVLLLCFVLLLWFYLFITLFIFVFLFFFLFCYLFSFCVHILTKYNGWKSWLLRSPECKQTYVKQFIPCKN